MVCSECVGDVGQCSLFCKESRICRSIGCIDKLCITLQGFKISNFGEMDAISERFIAF